MTEAIKADKVMDLKGLPCPMPVVKVRIVAIALRYADQLVTKTSKFVLMRSLSCRIWSRIKSLTFLVTIQLIDLQLVIH